MDLHTLVSRIQDLALEAEIRAITMPEGCGPISGTKRLEIGANDPCSNPRYYADSFDLKDGVLLHDDDEIERRLKKIADKVAAYDSMESAHV